MIASYTGKATIVPPDDEPLEVMVHIQVRHQIDTVWLNWWDGRITSGDDVSRLVGRMVTLLLPSGRMATAEITERGGTLAGVGDAPF